MLLSIPCSPFKFSNLLLMIQVDTSSSQTSPNMPWLASYPETIAKYVATRMAIGKETGLVRNDT